MARPLRHPKTGMYWLRLRVPRDLKALVGKREEKRSLRTKDPTAAKSAFAVELTRVHERWANVRAGARMFTAREAAAFSKDVYDEMLAFNREDRSVFAGMRAASLKWADEAGGHPSREKLEALFGGMLDRALAAKGIAPDPRSRFMLLEATRRAALQASDKILREREGDYSPDPNLARFPPPFDRSRSTRIQDLWADYCAERKPSPRTISRWQPVFRRFEAFAKESDLAKIEPAVVVAYKDHLLVPSQMWLELRAT